MNCARCNKRLSRKTARQIGREVICSACLFPELKRGVPTRDSDRLPKGEDAERSGAAECEASQSGG